MMEKTSETYKQPTLLDTSAIPRQMQQEPMQIADEYTQPPQQSFADLEKQKNFREYNQEQIVFLPLQLSNLLEETDPVYVLNNIVEHMDLTILYQKYSHEGNQPFHPKMMLKILFWGYYKNAMSCRKMQDALKYRADFIYLAAGQVPDFRTINDFRLRHLDILPDLFTQVVLFCQELDMIGFEHLCIDGEKIHANASFRKSKNLEQLEKEYIKISSAMEKLLHKETNEHFTEEKKEQRLERLASQIEKLDGLKLRLESLDDKNARINMTDPDAPQMKQKDGTSKPCYNNQSAVDSMYGVTCAVQTETELDKPKDMLALVDKTKEATGETFLNISADSAFCDYATLKEVQTNREENFLLPDKKFKVSLQNNSKKGIFDGEKFERTDQGGVICPAGHPMILKRTEVFTDGHITKRFEGTQCEVCPFHDKCTKGKKRTIHIDSREIYREEMRRKLISDEGRERYMERQWVVEAPHGDDQKNRGWRQHHLRGRLKALGEFVLIRIVSNLRKIIKFRTAEVLAMS